MAFLDNSGDIILDAVLTDTGRLRLAQGDGSFKITKFALGDDEINYGLYNKVHPSGSAYYDIEILQTPILEAFTNNTSNLNSKLLSMSRTNLLFMPTLKLNKTDGTGGTGGNTDLDSFMYIRKDSKANSSIVTLSKFVVACDATTYEVLVNNVDITGAAVLWPRGVIQGYTPSPDTLAGGLIRVDQGLDTDQINPTAGLDSDLVETQYILEVDYRLGRIAQPRTHTTTDVNFIDDDNIASYYIAGTNYIRNNSYTGSVADGITANDAQVFAGPRGTSLLFRLRASTELQYSTYLFEQVGTSLANTALEDSFGISADSVTSTSAGANAKLYYIDSTVRVVGANTGFRIDIPVRYVKIQ